jgi:hypothetical protein
MYQGWTVLCDSPEVDGKSCCVMDQVSGTKARAKKSFKESGWSFKQGRSLCPDCTKELAKMTTK